MIRVDKEFETLIPPLTSEEFSQLEENCVREGIRDPLVVWAAPNGEKILVDGHNRWKISAKHGGIQFKVAEMQFEDREAAKEWILKNQLGRRNLDIYVRSMLGTRTDISQKSVKSHDTQKELAKVAGVSHDTIHKVEVVEKNAPEEIKEKARRGDISINEAYKQTANIMRPLKKTDIAKEAEEEHREYEQRKDAGIVSVKDAAVDRENRRILATELSKRITKAINAVQDISLLKGDMKSIIAELGEEDRREICGNLVDLTSMLIVLREQIGGISGEI